VQPIDPNQPDAALKSPDVVAEISCRPIKCMVLTFRKLRGEEALVRSLAKAGVDLPLSFLEDENNWVSFALSQRILDQLSIDSGIDDFPRRAGLAIGTQEVLGLAYSLLKAFGSPKLVYQRIVDIGAQANRMGTFSILSLDQTHLKLEYRSKVVEPNRRFCEFRQGNLQSFPLIWGLPEAKAVETTCQARGDGCCSYTFEWQAPPTWRFLALGTVVGAGAGFLFERLGFLDMPVWFATALPAGMGALVGMLLDSRRELRLRDQLLDRQNSDLMGSITSLTERYEEIAELNRTLERKVDERTAELAAARDKLQVALAKAVALDRAKTQFFTNISHELRTPLTLILAPLETAMAEWVDAPESTRGQLQMMHRNGVRLLDNINQLLDLSRLDAGRARLKLAELDPVEVISSLVEASQGLARQRGIELKFEVQGDVPRLQADRDKLEKITLNLLGNALKFTRATPEQPRPWVRVRCGAEGGKFAFYVSDSGIGIPQDQIGSIFERFSQVSGGDRREYGGSGIGLALAKELVEFQMGTITVSSIEGVGSTFAVRLPISREAIPEDRLDRRREKRDVVLDRRREEEARKLAALFRDPQQLEVLHPEARHAAPPSEQPEPPESQTPAGGVLPIAARLQSAAAAGEAQQGLRSDPPPLVSAAGKRDVPTVVLADDNLDMLSYLSRLLHRDYRVLTAADGEQALQLVRRERPALVVSDVMMPRMDGYQLLTQIRAAEETRHIPVILLTAKSEVGQKIHGLEQGADDYLSKPFNFLEFRARVRQLLKNRELERQLAEKNDYLAKLNFDLVLSKKEVFLQTIEAITIALEAKDTYTHGHSYRVATLSAEFARELALSEVEVERVRLSALLHDVGKIGIREGILNKPGRLTPEEYLEIQRHPEIGARIIERVADLKDVTRCVRFHHESWDGSGYPGHLKYREIPLESRVIAIADTYDAMTSDRAYRKGLGHARAMQEIRDYAGRQFDPEMTRIFLRRYEERPPEYPQFPSAFAAGFG
jgi:putative nucleotidyltransferase with HDIG domain